MDIKKLKKQKNVTLEAITEVESYLLAQLNEVRAFKSEFRQQEYQKIMQTTFATDEELDNFLATMKNQNYNLYNINKYEQTTNTSGVGAKYEKTESDYPLAGQSK